MLHWVPLAFFVALLILYFSGGSQPFVFKGMIASILCITVPKLLFCIVSLLGLGAGLVQCAGGCSDTVRGSLTAGFDIAGMALAGCFLVAAVYGLTAGPRHLVLREENLVFDDLPASFDGYRIVHLSDFHASSYSAPGMVERLVSEVNALEADLVVFTGDLVNSSPEELDAGMMKALSDIRARDGVFSVVGNHDACEYHEYADAGGAARAFSEVVRRERAMGWTVLLDSSAVITRTAVTPLRDTRELDLPESPASVERVDSIYIVGVEHCGKPPFGSRGNLQKALSGVPSVISPKEQSSVSPFKSLPRAGCIPSGTAFTRLMPGQRMLQALPLDAYLPALMTAPHWPAGSNNGQAAGMRRAFSMSQPVSEAHFPSVSVPGPKLSS